MYPGQDEIHDYLKRCVQRYEHASHIRLNTRFQEALWNEAESVWRAAAGEGMRIRARVLTAGFGGLHVPQYPKLTGFERFAGPQFILPLGITASTCMART